jgi:hypothetical protein
MSYAQRVEEIIKDAMFTKEEVDTHGGDALLEMCVKSEGIVCVFGFHPERLEQNREKIVDLVKEIVADEFLRDHGGGMSFLQLCEARNGELWGEHHQCDALFCLAQAIGHARYCMPRDMWSVFPGGMPYVCFSHEKFTEAA